MRGSLVSLVAACAAPARPPAERPREVLPEQRAQPACIKPNEEAPKILHARGDEAKVSYCIGPGADDCFTLDLASSTLAHLARPSDPAPATRVELTKPTLQVCTGSACTVVTPSSWPKIDASRAVSNGNVAVILVGDGDARGVAEVYDVARSQKLASIRYPRGDHQCGVPALLGDTIYLGANACAAPAGRAALYTTKGKKIANVGTGEFGTYGDQFVQLEGARWAFLGENGASLAIQDVVKGKVQKTIKLGVLWTADGTVKDAFGNPGESALIKLSATKVGVVAGSPMNGSVAIVDVASGEVTVVHALACP